MYCNVEFDTIYVHFTVDILRQYITLSERAHIRSCGICLFEIRYGALSDFATKTET